MVVNPEFPEGGVPDSGRHRAPDGDAQTAYIPRITDASPDGVPGGPLEPPVGLYTPPPRPVESSPADTAVLGTDGAVAAPETERYTAARPNVEYRYPSET